MIDFLLGVPGKLATIYTHLTTHLGSTRAAKIDNLDAAISTRSAAATALSTATWTGTRAGYLDNLNDGGIPGTVKSIQTDVFYATTGTVAGTGEDDQYKDITITSVTTAKSVVTIQPIIDPTYGPVATTARLTSATNLRISNSDSNSNFIGARWTVIEYDF